MQNYSFVFENKGTQIYNDVVLPLNAFEIVNNKFEFTVIPKTKFWRFGIRLSKTETVEFLHPKARHNNFSPDIHLGVGDWDGKNWTNANNIHLVQYNLKNLKSELLFSDNNYKELEIVDFIIEFDSKRGLLNINYLTNGCVPFTTSLDIGFDFQYLAVFAWADSVDYKLECSIKIISKETTENILVTPIPKFWILRLNPDSFDIEKFEEGEEISFGTFDTKFHKRMEYDLYQKVQVDDIVLGYRLTNNPSIVWHLKVKRSVHSDPIIGECIILVIVKIFSPEIELSRFSDIISEKAVIELVEKGSIRLIEISENDYEKICNSGERIVKAVNSRIGEFKISSKPDKNLLEIGNLTLIFRDLIINAQESEEQFFALFGRWGRGKTHFWELLKKEINPLNTKTIFYPIDFQAWKYQDTPAIWAHLYDIFSKAFNPEPTKWFELCKWRKYYFNLFKLNINRGKFYRPVLKMVAAICLGVLGIYLLNESRSLSPYIDWIKENTIKSLLLLFPTTLYGILAFINKNYKQDAKKILSEIVTKTTFESHLGLQHEIQKELMFLLETWIPKSRIQKKKVLLFIDDIDRCSEDKIIQIVDYIRVLLHHPEIQKRLTVVAAIDERILVYAIRNKYKNFVENKEETFKILCREYLDKLFIASLKLSELTSKEKKEILIGFTNTLVNNTIGLSSSNNEAAPFNKLKETLSLEDNNQLIFETAKTIQNKLSILETTFRESTILKTKKTESKNLYILNQIEQTDLENLFYRYSDSTPRGIRVFIIRYLLGKRIIETYLADDSEEYIIWNQNQVIKKYFASQLLRFSILEDINSLSITYNSILGRENNNQFVEEKCLDKTYNIPHKINVIIFQTLNMIIPY